MTMSISSLLPRINRFAYLGALCGLALLVMTVPPGARSAVPRATTAPTAIAGLELWLDASDPDGDGDATNNPSDGTTLTTWQDKSGANHDASVAPGKNAGTFTSAAGSAINAQPVIRFTRTGHYSGSVYHVPGVDIRAGTMPDVTILTVFRPTTTPSQGHALWGVDNGDWDRFFWAYHPSFGDGVDDGLVGLGPAQQGQAVDDSGQVGMVRLMTAVYDGTVNGTVNSGPANGSAIYFDGKVVRRFTDSTHPTNAQSSLYLGWDGDDAVFDGDVAEVLVYSRALDSCEIQQLNTYLGDKYGRDFSTPAPGGISDEATCNLDLWLKADAGVTSAAGTVTSWADQIGTNTFTAHGDPQTGVNRLNFNNVVVFDGRDDSLLGNTNTTFAEVFVVASRDPNGGTPLAGEGATAGMCGAYFFRRIDGQSYVADAEPNDIRTTEGDPGGYQLLNSTLAGGSSGIASRISINGVDQRVEEAAAAGPLDPFTAIPVLGRCGNGTHFLNGQVAEVIVYDRALSTQERQKVESYLALKYGMTFGLAMNYIASDGTVVWNAMTNASYFNDIAGIGLDQTGALRQLQSRSINGDGIVTMIANDADLADKEFLIWGNDDAAITASQNVPDGFHHRLLRAWRVQETGDIGNLRVSFDLAGYHQPDFSDTAGFALLVDDDGDFSNATPFTGATINGSIVSFNNVDFSNGHYFSLAFPLLDTTAPAAPTFTTPADLNDSWPTIAGMAEPHSIVTLVLDLDTNPATTDDRVTFTTMTSAAGVWSINTRTAIPTSGALPAGGIARGTTVRAEVTARDEAGNTSSPTVKEFLLPMLAYYFPLVFGSDQ